MVTMPALDSVEHGFVDLGGGVTIHVADAGPPDGPAVMLVHGFPQNWWQWHSLIGPLADDGYRVLCPDLRGAGWSSAPRSRYLKNEMAADLARVLDRLGVGPVKLVAHDWGGPVAFIMMLRHPAKVTGFFGLNTAAPWVSRDLTTVRHLWRFWYQIPNACVSPGMRSPGRGGSAHSRPGKCCAGCAASSPTPVSTSRSAGCTAPVTKFLYRAYCAAMPSGQEISRWRWSTVWAIGSSNSGPIWYSTGSASSSGRKA